MLELQISATTREKFGKQNKSLRDSGVIPAVVYGKGMDTAHISLNLKDFSKIYKQAGESTIVSLNIDNNGKVEQKPVLIHDVDFDPVSDVLRHVDFHLVNMKEKITATIPLVFIGESSAVKVLSGIFFKNIHEVEVESLPADLPHQIEVDISVIDSFDKHISIKDLKLPSGVVILSDPNETIASVKPPRTEEELKALEGEVKIDVDAVKVESEEKKKETAEKEASEEASK